MEIAQYILLGITSALLIGFIVVLTMYLVKTKKKKEFNVKLYERIIYITAIVLFIFSIAFSIINIVSAI
ncbi:MAG: hypothetical protein SOW55_03765 [Bacilli bacterium]|nr:hypothetical protein [Bacillales bacterium]MDY2575072.1 hypothetical protein [Bacilli bacterium]